MKYVLLILAVFGMVVAALALREHYREYGDSPCSINEHWDCGVVNHSVCAGGRGSSGVERQCLYWEPFRGDSGNSSDTW